MSNLGLSGWCDEPDPIHVRDYGDLDPDGVAAAFSDWGGMRVRVITGTMIEACRHRYWAIDHYDVETGACRCPEYEDAWSEFEEAAEADRVSSTMATRIRLRHADQWLSACAPSSPSYFGDGFRVYDPPLPGM